LRMTLLTIDYARVFAPMPRVSVRITPIEKRRFLRRLRRLNLRSDARSFTALSPRSTGFYLYDASIAEKVACRGRVDCPIV